MLALTQGLLEASLVGRTLVAKPRDPQGIARVLGWCSLESDRKKNLLGFKNNISDISDLLSNETKVVKNKVSVSSSSISFRKHLNVNENGGKA